MKPSSWYRGGDSVKKKCMNFNCNKVYFNNKRSSSNVIRKVQENKYLVRGNYCCKYKAFVNINVCYFKKFHI